MAEELPYGTWRSEVSARTVAATTCLGPVALGPDGSIWWQETRPEEDGRVHVLWAAATGPSVEVLAEQGCSGRPGRFVAIGRWRPGGVVRGWPAAAGACGCGPAAAGLRTGRFVR